MSARILVVEDEQIVAEDLRHRLHSMGHEVVGTAAEGREAVRMAVDLKPDLVLMDVRLQGTIDGIQAARLIHIMLETPIVYITAYSHVFVHGGVEMQPPGVCIAKPFSQEQLSATLSVVLSHTKQ